MAAATMSSPKISPHLPNGMFEVTSSEPPEFDGDGNFLPDHSILAVDAASGVIQLELRAERSGKGDGRTYTVLVTATDISGQSSTAAVEVKAPHSKKKF